MELTRVLQTAVSPVVLISGIGLLLLAMTNRYAHTTDRTRQLAKTMRASEPDDAAHLAAQVRILYRRLRIQLIAISFALLSVFSAAMLVMTLFAVYLWNALVENLIVLFFMLGMISLMVSIIFFIIDMTMSLNALKDELRDVRGGRRQKS